MTILRRIGHGAFYRNLSCPNAIRNIAAFDLRRRYPIYRMEILSPATVDTYRSAVYAGADAIYFGYGQLNARVGAANANDYEQLKEIVDFCHKLGVKAYLTLNTMLKETELDEAKKVVQLAEKVKIDAFIISDLALLPMIRKYSSAAVHASTQMGIHGIASAQFAKRLGFDRVVLSRESRPIDVLNVKRDLEIETEIFGHGAICTGFSGSCLFSAMKNGKSGNRGRCAQLCRKEYTLKINGEEVYDGHLLSAKDNCLAEQLFDVKGLLTTSLKIEGRLKNSAYVEGTTSTYAYLRDCDFIAYNEDIADYLKTLFNRGNFTPSYWLTNDVIYPEAPNHIGVEYGKVIEIISKNLVLIKTIREIEKDDCFRVVRDDEEIGGIVATGEIKYIDDDPDDMAYVCFAPCDVELEDEVYLTKTASIHKFERKLHVDLIVRIVADEEVRVAYSYRGKNFEYVGDVVDRAISEPISVEDIVRQFERTNDDDIVFNFVKVVTDDAFVTKKKLNEIRREVLELIRKDIIDGYVRPDVVKKCPSFSPKEKIKGDFIQLDDISQLSDYIKNRFKNIVYSPKDECSYYKCRNFLMAAKTDDNLLFLNLPNFIHSCYEEEIMSIIKLYDGVVANNYGLYEMALQLRKKVVAGWNLNVGNTKNPLLRWSNQTVISTELSAEELRSFPDSLVYTYGRLPLMHVSFCPKRLYFGNCSYCKEVKDISILDGNTEYPIISKTFYKQCQHVMLNDSITNLGSLVGNNPRFFDFSMTTLKDIEAILEKYYSDSAVFPDGFDHLRMEKGVE